MSAWRSAALLCVPLFSTLGTAHAQSDALGWLRKIQDATRNLSYSGTFVYQHGGRSETSRITRLAAADTERLEVLDGMPRELVRTRDTVRCYLPESKVVKVERRTPDRSFPALLPERLNALAQHYDISLGETRRVGGFECQAVVLTPKDNLRYGYRLYADTASGMLVRAVTVDAAGNQIEQFMFTQLSIGRVTPEIPASTRWWSSRAAWANRSRSGRWCTPTASPRSRCSSSRCRRAASRRAPGSRASAPSISILARSPITW